MSRQFDHPYSSLIFGLWTGGAHLALPGLSGLAILTLGVFFFTVGAADAVTEKADPALKSGEIRGVVDYCGSDGAGDFRVHIPGRSFVVYTPSTGEFVLNYVPVGTWSLKVERHGKVVKAINGVTVESRHTTDLGTVSICPDADGDGFNQDVDCDDGNPAIKPDAADICGDGIDNDCSGEADEGCPVCTDFDGDGYFAQLACPTERDCNDQDAGINPGAEEICGGGDNNCDGVVDEPGAVGETVFYRDADGDGYGDFSYSVLACYPPVGFVNNLGDCNDQNASINPGATEICGDGIDNDCNGVDEGCVDCTDSDGDGYFRQLSCSTEVDCNDQNASINPGATEICGDGIDNDCNGVDEGCPAVCVTDGDCPAEAHCNIASGACLLDLPNGNGCFADTECLSGYCVDGICCQSTCNDQLSCTVDSCGQGICTNALQASSCLIEGVCYGAGDPNPVNPSQQCIPAVNATGWTQVP